MAATLAACHEGLEDEAKAKVAEEVCRILTQISQIREEVVYPFCVDRAPGSLLDAFVIEEDWIRVLVAEIRAAGPSALLYDGLIAALKDAVRQRWTSEEAPGGLWERVGGGPGLAEADVRIGDRLGDANSRAGEWEPLLPAGLETLCNSVPPGATRWTDL